MLHNNHTLPSWEQKLIARAARECCERGKSAFSGVIGPKAPGASDRSDPSDSVKAVRAQGAGVRATRLRHAATIELRLASLFED